VLFHRLDGARRLAKPWNIADDLYLDAIEGICRFTVQHRTRAGAVIDPFLHREHQYSTPYFAFASARSSTPGEPAICCQTGFARWTTPQVFPKGDPGIPDAHGEFFLASLPGALGLYENQRCRRRRWPSGG